MDNPESPKLHVVTLKPVEANILRKKAYVLHTSTDMEITQVMLHAGETFEFHKSMRQRSVQVLQGRIVIQSEGVKEALLPGQVAIFASDSTFLVEAVDDSSVVCNLVLPIAANLQNPAEDDAITSIDQGLEDTFPASDPVAHSEHAGS